jgi:hypothetical protein
MILLKSKKRSDIELLINTLGLILIGISLLLTFYGVSKRLVTDLNVYRLVDILEFSYLTLYTQNNYELNVGDIKKLEIGNDTIKLENVCLISESKSNLLFIKLNPLSKSKNKDSLKFLKKVGKFGKKNIVTLSTIAEGALLLKKINDIKSKLSFNCIIKGDEFKLGKFYNLDVVLKAKGKTGNKIKYSLNVENNKLVINLFLHEFFK